MNQFRETLVSGVVLYEERIREIKKHLAIHIGEVQPGMRMEIFARFVGFRTYASLLATLKVSPVDISKIDISNTLDFCASKNASSNEEDLLLALYRLIDYLDEGAIHTPNNR